MNADLEKIETPAVLVDWDVLQNNIARAARLCAAAGVLLRPHIKTHKIPRFAKMQLRAGAVGITCQTLGEAEVMAAAGVGDILISYNITGASKLARLRKLFFGVNTLRVCADNEFIIDGLSATFAKSKKPLPVLVECDTGAKRAGVVSAQAAAALAQKIAAAPGLAFAGLLTYPPPHDTARVEAKIVDAQKACARVGLSCAIVSNGGTPGLSAVGAATTATEYRAGTYVYNDRSMVACGACALRDCALTVLTTVVSVPAAGRGIVDAGSKTLSSDLLGLPDYGEAQGAPGVRVSALSEEHGHLTFPKTLALRPGTKLRIIPNHACVVSNLAEHIILIKNGKPTTRILVARKREK